MELRNYQNDIINKCRIAFKKGYKRPLIVLPCGSGKTVCFSYMAHKHTGNTWFLVHRQELVDQAKSVVGESNNIYIGMVGTALKKAPFDPTMIIFDECFPKNTKVMTPYGNKKISSLHNGDFVLSYNCKDNKAEFKPITHIFKKESYDLIKITLKNGKKIVCTANHPFYTKNGYMEAKDLYGKEVLLQNLWKGNFTDKIKQIQCYKTRLWNLLKRVQEQKFINDNGSNEQEICIRKDENKQSIQETRSSRKNKCYNEGKRFKTNFKRWKWSNNNATIQTLSSTCESRNSRCSRICYSNSCQETKHLSNELQGGYSNSRKKNSNRIRWEKPFERINKGTRQEKNCLSYWVGVESIKILERRNRQKSFRNCVYNIEVADNNNYFANDILVHNCHHATAKTWKNIIDKYPSVYIIGLTATPCRLDGSPLGNIFDCLIEGVTANWLIDNKYLAPYNYYAPALKTILPQIKGSDFDSNAILYESRIYGDVDKYISDKKTIIYCPNIAFSQAIAEQVGGVHFDGNTPKKEREHIIHDFKNGKIKILCNVDLIGEGFDVPDCECVMLLRPTMSLSLFIQQSMRCMRYQDNKTAIIYDFVGNCHRHGLPTDEHKWSLNQKLKVRNSNGVPDVITRMCKKCYRVYSGINPICPYCQYDNKKTRKQIEMEKEVELEQIKKIERREQGMAQDLQSLIALGKKRGYKNPTFWAKKILEGRYKRI